MTFFVRNTFETEENAVEKMRKEPTFMWKEVQLCTNRVINNGKNRIWVSYKYYLCSFSGDKNYLNIFFVSIDLESRMR